MHKLIIIDDEPLVLDQLCNFNKWRDLGFEIVGSFDDSEEAMQYIAENKVDAILSDIKMPPPNGIEISRVCAERYPNIQVALISSYRDFEYAKQAIKYNVYDYITKPIDYDRFYDSMENLSKKIDIVVEHTEFLDDCKYYDIQQVFSDLLCGITKDLHLLNEQLCRLGFSKLSIKNNCGLVNLNIENFSDYLSSVWKHGRDRLYNAITLLVPFETDESYSFLARYSNNNIEFIIINKDNNKDFNKILFSRCEEITQNTFALLNLTTKATSVQVFDSIAQLISEKPNSVLEQENEPQVIIKNALKYIEDHLSENVTSDNVASFVSLSPVYFRAYFKQHTNETFIAYLSRIRMKKAKDMLQNKNLKITAICDMIGYRNSTHFYKLFKGYYGVTPAAYRNSILRNESL